MEKQRVVFVRSLFEVPLPVPCEPLRLRRHPKFLVEGNHDGGGGRAPGGDLCPP